MLAREVVRVDTERWRRVTELFDAALERPPHERSGFVDGACAGDRELQREIESLLAAHDRDPDYLEASAELLLDVALVASERPTSADPLTGRRLGDWVLRERIDVGTAAVMYRAQPAQGAARVATVRLVEGSPAARAAAEQQQQLRARWLALSHPQLAGWLDAGVTADGIAYFVSECVDGTPIARHCAEHGLALHERVTLVAAACSVVASLHGLGMAHGALGDDCVLVGADGVVTVTGLGPNCRLVGPTTGAAPAVGTTAEGLPITEYSSPEQVRGGQATPASDVHALGVLLYELLTGKRPFLFATRSRGEIARLLAQGQVLRPSEACPRQRAELAGALDALVLRAIHPDPARRHGSAEALGDELRTFLERPPITARGAGPAGLVAVLHRFARAHPKTSATVAVAALVLLGSGALAWISSRTSRATTAEAGRLAPDLAASWSELLRLAGMPVAQPSTDPGAVLDAVELRAEALAAQPQRQARMWRLLADLRRARGEAARARLLLQKLLAYQRATLPPDAPALTATARELQRLEQAGRTDPSR